MGKIEDLYTLEHLLKEFDLPISPILDYAIKEKIADVFSAEMTSPEVCQMYSGKDSIKSFDVHSVVAPSRIKSDVKQNKALSDYANDFASLSVAVLKGKKLPNKAVLLLSIMQLIEDGELNNNIIPLDKSIAGAFVKSWDKYFDTKAPSVWIPFYHLNGEPFWHFKASESDEILDKFLGLVGTPSIGKMRQIISYAYFDEDLFGLLNVGSNRELLKQVLIENYLS